MGDGMNNPKLTISVLISRNYDGVKKCLDSISPIMDKVPSELILTDTGCGDKVRELIEGYTDHIIDFEWIKDFSAARNAGLKEAKGEWFLYIDDDEWFDDVTELVKFFNSGECDRYNVAAYVQRNYLDMDGNTYGEHNVDRIIRITPELHFEHRIHEAYTGIDIGTKKRLNTFVHHYGYAYKNEEERIEKSKRNRELLILECEEHPEDMRMRYQLVLDYYGIHEFDEAIEAALSGIKIKSDSQYWDALHTEALYCFQAKEDWDSLIRYGEKFLNDRLFPNDEFGVRQYLICAYWNQKEYDKICNLAQKVIATYIDYKKNPAKYDANQLMRDEFWKIDKISKMLIFIIDSALATNDSGIIDKLLNHSIREELTGLIHNDTYKTWLTQIVIGTCSEPSQIELFMRLPIAGNVNNVKLDAFVGQVDNMFPFIPLDKFDIWRDWILSQLEEGSEKHAYFLAKCYDYKLRSISFHIADMDEYDSLEYVLSLITGYADREMAYCEGKYRDKLESMTEDDLLPEEKLAWQIQELVDQVDAGNVSDAINTVRDITGIAPYWSDAISFLPTYIQLVLGSQ